MAHFVKSIKYVWLWGIPFSVVFLQFTVFYPLGFPFTIGFIATIPLIFLFLKESKLKNSLFIIALVSFVNALQLFFMDFSSIGYWEYIKTFLLIMYNLALWCGASYLIRLPFPDMFRVGVRRALFVVCAFTILQHVSFYFIGESLFGVFGDYSYRGVIHPAVTQAKVRAYATYLEPSYCGLVVVSLFVSDWLARPKLNIGMAIITLLACLATNSIATIATIVMIIFTIVVIENRNESGGRKSILNIGIGMAAVLVSVSLYFSRNYVERRLDDLGNEGTSSYYRMVAPLEMLKDTLLEYPIGRGLGTVEYTVREYTLVQAGQAAQSLDNGLYLVVFYYGWVGVAFWCALVYVMTKSAFKSNYRMSLFIMYIILSSNFSGGGIFNAEYGLLVCFALISLKFGERNKFVLR